MAPALRPAIAFHADVGVGARELVDLARRAELRGFGGAYMIEYEYDALAYVLALALGTQRIRVGTAVARMPARPPLALAESAAAVAAYAPGRLVLGLGSGPGPRATGAGRAGGEWFARHADEYLDVVAGALRGDRLDHAGEHFRVDGVTLPNPPATAVPILFAAGGPRAIRVAAERADGMFLFLRDAEGAARAAGALREAAARAGRDPEALTVAALVPTCVGEDEETARAALRARLVGTYLRRPLNRRLLAEAGFAGAARAVGERLAAGDAAGAEAALPPEAVDALGIAGTGAACRERLARFVAASGVTEVVLYATPATGDWSEGYARAIEAFAAPA
jgi:alkanesulfonate monooxygenase SsuD/methylene tetrahydromethanopterin reductase-like flavin-dependent oxidoreductase (luciferase family)